MAHLWSIAVLIVALHSLVLVLAWKNMDASLRSRIFVGLLLTAIGVELLVTATLGGKLSVAGSEVPKVVYLSTDVEPLGDDVWMIWESKDNYTFLVRRKIGEYGLNTLVTIPRDEMDKIEVTRYDRIFRELFVKKEPLETENE
ncbi:MAG: hypothetical protein IH935_12330 [Acidobacteria bacterium]|nr:hypothetical protein [Acidobacteriota bacterium]